MTDTPNDAKEVAHIVVAEAIRLLEDGKVEAAIETLRLLLKELRAE